MHGTMISGGVCTPQGFKAAGVACGIKDSGELDLCLLTSDRSCCAAGTFTSNAFRAAPLIVTLEHLEKSRLQAVVVNSGNANAWTGDRGLRDARAMAELVARQLGVDPSGVAVASTGVIGSYLSMEKIEEGIKGAARRLSEDGGGEAARAIMTTDTFPKEVALECDSFRIGGMAKGAGMIKPNMATMLGFITTDAKVERQQLAEVLRAVVDATFNSVNIDGCTSTNDMVLLLANGASGVELTGRELEGPLYEVCAGLARMLVEDAEGATHFISIKVRQAASGTEAKRLATAIAESVLVKTAFFGGDPNWGRIVQAIGAAQPALDPAKVVVKMGGLLVAESGEPAQADGNSLRQTMAAREIELDIAVGRGEAEAEIWTCDLSYDYVKLNAEYHT